MGPVVVAVRLIEQIGSYAGIAAIPGLAVLSALYFSQARDVKRLREWAGRAPERAAEQAAGGRVVAQPAATTAKPAAATDAAGTAAAPAAAAATAGAKPATATATPATAATAEKPAAAAAGAASTNGETATPAADTDTDSKPEAAEEPAKKEEEQPAAATAGAKPATPAGAAAAASGGGGGSSATGTVTRPGPPAIAGVRPTRTIPRVPAGAQTSILTPASAGRGDDPWYRRLGARLPAARYIALIVAGVLVLGGGAVFGISELAKKDSANETKAPVVEEPSSGGSDEPKKPHKSAIDPSGVTVTVVNGTTIAGLARDTATKLSGYGFQIGNKVTGTGSLAAAESVVLYKPGAEDEARLVAQKLHIDPTEPADADAIAQAGPASVIVVLGADQAPGG